MDSLQQKTHLVVLEAGTATWPRFTGTDLHDSAAT